MRVWVISFLLGIVSLSFFQNLPNLWWATAGLAPLPLFWLSPSFLWRWLRLPLAIAVGFSWALLHACWYAHHTLPPALENKVILAQGGILSVPEHKNYGWQFDFAIKNIAYRNAWQPLPLRVRLLWKYPVARLWASEQWQLQVQLQRPHSTLNPGEFDYEAWLFAHQISALGHVRPQGDNRLLHTAHWSAVIQHLRQNSAQLIAVSLHGSPMTGFIQALAVGIRDRITEDQWEVLRNTGTNHLMAIAGLHIGLMTGVIWFLVSFMARRCGNLPLYVPITQLAAFSALLVALIYSALAGFALPAQRAVIMVSVFLLAALLRRQLPSGQGLLLALCLVLLIDPFATLSASFWLSFGAVALIIYGLTARIRQPAKWLHWGYLQWVITVGLMPLTLLFFQQISFGGLLANFLAIPWVGFIILPLTLLGNLTACFSPSAATWVFKLAAQLMAWFWPVLVNIASWHWLQWQAVIPGYGLLFTTSAGTVLLLGPRGLPGRWLGIIWLLPLLFWQPATPPARQVWLTVLDVNQGLVAVIRTQHHALIYHVAPYFKTNPAKISDIVQPFLRSNNLKHVGTLVLNSNENNALASFPIEWNMLTPQTFFSNFAGAPGFENAVPCLAGNSWQWDGVEFAFIYPEFAAHSGYSRDSCVLQITAGHQHILLLGPVGNYGANQLVRYSASALPADVLVATAYRSRTTVQAKILTAVQPRYVLYSGNWPLASMPSTTLYNVSTCGAITIRAGEKITMSAPDCYRYSQGHYWNH